MALSESQNRLLGYYTDRYDTIFEMPLVSDGPVYIPGKVAGAARTCRFCKKTEPEVTFKTKAHAVPELLGNKSLLSSQECDACNAFFAKEYEDHLAKWFGPMRTFAQIHGKRGVPAYKDKDFEDGGKIRVEMGEDGLHFSIVNKDMFDELSQGGDGPFKFKLPVDTPSQPHVPLSAAKALMKVACTLVPAEEIQQCDTVIQWLMGTVDAKVSMYPVIHIFTPGPNPHGAGWVRILRRKVDEPIPYLWCIIGTANFQFQFFVPFCPADEWLKNGATSKTTLFRYPEPFGPDWPYGESEIYFEDWSGAEPVVKQPSVTFNVDRAVLIDRKGDEEQPEAPTDSAS